jgi:uncharacterized membrane protein
MEKKNRAQFIDLLKGLALLVMIEVHVVNVFLSAQIKSQSWFEILNFINGLVAPAFTFTSGMVFILSFQRGLDELRKFGSKFWKRVGRLVIIFLAGYTIHMPFFSFTKISDPRYPHMIREFLRVDILQCIAVGLMLLLFLRIFINSDKVFYWSLILLDLFVLAYSPIAWQTNYAHVIPLSVANYFNRIHDSLFPLFPWISFILTGALVGKLYTDSKNNNLEQLFAKQMIYAGAFFFLICVLFLNILFPDNWVSVKPNYFFFFERIGVLLLLLGIFWFYVNHFPNYNSFILEVSRESLLVYWLHLKLLYLSIKNDKNIIELLGSELNILECAAITIILAIIMVYTAKLWGMLKIEYPVAVSRGVFIMVTAAVIIFFFY